MFKPTDVSSASTYTGDTPTRVAMVDQPPICEHEGAPQNELDAVATRLAEVLNRHSRSEKLKKDDITLRMISDFCWALGVEPDVRLIRRHHVASATDEDGGA